MTFEWTDIENRAITDEVRSASLCENMCHGALRTDRTHRMSGIIDSTILKNMFMIQRVKKQYPWSKSKNSIETVNSHMLDRQNWNAIGSISDENPPGVEDQCWWSLVDRQCIQKWYNVMKYSSNWLNDYKYPQPQRQPSDEMKKWPRSSKLKEISGIN